MFTRVRAWMACIGPGRTFPATVQTMWIGASNPALRLSVHVTANTAATHKKKEGPARQRGGFRAAPAVFGCNGGRRFRFLLECLFSRCYAVPESDAGQVRI
jgi:hypothetical protein